MATSPASRPFPLNSRVLIRDIEIYGTVVEHGMDGGHRVYRVRPFLNSNIRNATRAAAWYRAESLDRVSEDTDMRILMPIDPPIVQLTPFIPTQGAPVVIVVGAGGTGARILPPLIKVMPTEGTIYVLDGDIVEERNLHRQHFTNDDIGRYKAEIMQDRYSRVARGPEVIAIPAMLNQISRQEIIRLLGGQGALPGSVLILGCVDSGAARVEIMHLVFSLHGLLNHNIAYIDIGNETSTGQAIIAYSNWAMNQTLQGGFVGGQAITPGYLSYLFILGWVGMPELWDPAVDATDPTINCAFRIDIQTVQINQLAATMGLTLASSFLQGTPVRYPGLRFSSDGLVLPIPWGQRSHQYHLMPPAGAGVGIPSLTTLVRDQPTQSCLPETLRQLTPTT